jgi:hypothetical protein
LIITFGWLLPEGPVEPKSGKRRAKAEKRREGGPGMK